MGHFHQIFGLFGLVANKVWGKKRNDFLHDLMMFGWFYSTGYDTSIWVD